MEYENIASMNKALSRINGLYQKWCQSHTVNMYLLKVLYALYMEPDLQQKELSRNYQIPSQTVNNSIQNLKKSAYIELKQDEQDKRRKKISFTDTGMEYAKEVLAPMLELDQNIASRLGSEKFGQLTALLYAYGDALEQETAFNTLGGSKHDL